MKIAIIGAGNVGGTLGKAMHRVGHTIHFGATHPSDPKMVATARDASALVGTNAEAVVDADMILLATPWPATQGAIASVGKLNGKIVVDCTNPIKSDFSDLEAGVSGAERIQTWIPEAKVVKCFNQTGFENMDKPGYAAGQAFMFAAGDDEAALSRVAQFGD